MRISKEQARKFLVIYHHLHRDNPISNETELMNYIKKVGCIQYDPINVLAYNSHLVLQSKVVDYRPSILDELLYDRCELIDAWDKNLSIYHISDDLYFERYRRRTHRYYTKLDQPVHDVMPTLRKYMEDNGPMSSIDIKDSPTIDWAWAPTKAVRAGLDYMFSNGEVYVHHKVNTRKYYDLIEHHPKIKRRDFSFENEASYFRWHVLRRIGGVGMLPAMVDSYGFIAVDGLKAPIRRQTVQDLLDRGALEEIHIEGASKTYYMRCEDLALLDDLDSYEDKAPACKIIAALDNLIWDRDMIEDLFDFKYRWEVYVPEAKRVYGYYVLPLLYGYDFIGRLVMKYNRKSNKLEIYHLYLEDSIDVAQLSSGEVKKMFLEFADFLGADGLEVMKGAVNGYYLKSHL